MSDTVSEIEREAREVISDARWETSQRVPVSRRRNDAETEDIALMRISFGVVGGNWKPQKRFDVEREIRRILRG